MCHGTFCWILRSSGVLINYWNLGEAFSRISQVPYIIWSAGDVLTHTPPCGGIGGAGTLHNAYSQYELATDFCLDNFVPRLFRGYCLDNKVERRGNLQVMIGQDLLKLSIVAPANTHPYISNNSFRGYEALNFRSNSSVDYMLVKQLSLFSRRVLYAWLLKWMFRLADFVT